MNLIVDLGNSRLKIAIFKNGDLVHRKVFSHDNILKNILHSLKSFPCSNAIIASVSQISNAQIEELSKEINVIQLTYRTKVPFKNGYATPQTLGVDRLALVASAISSYPNSNVLIIDAGTCITYDFVNELNIYEGGGISPGIIMRYKSLHTFTENLPLLEPKDEYMLIGNSTETCIHSGVINGVITEIDSIIDLYRKKHSNLTVVLTGGDINFLSNRLKNSIFANPNFLLEGLNSILTYNLD